MAVEPRHLSSECVAESVVASESFMYVDGVTDQSYTLPISIYEIQ